MRLLLINKYNLLHLVFAFSCFLPLLIPHIPIGNYLLFLTIPYLVVLTIITRGLKAISVYFILVGLFVTLTISIINHSKFVPFYFFIDFIKLLVVIYILELIDQPVPKKLFFHICIVLISVNLIGLLIPGFYVNSRFSGLLRNTNMTVYLISFAIFYCYVYIEKIKSPRVQKKYFILFLLLFIVLTITSQSRSYLLGLLTFLFFSRKFINWKILLFGFSFSVLIVLFLANQTDISKLLIDNRLSTKESSFLTRLSIYEHLLTKIEHAKGLPNGPNSDQIYVNSISRLKGMHAHNDILKYIFNYGFLFVLFIIFIARKLISRKTFLAQEIALFLFFISTSLHGYLFLFLLMHPYIMTLNLLESEDPSLQPAHVKEPNSLSWFSNQACLEKT